MLQSAYLHDIGINPRRTVVQLIRDFLFTGSRGELEQREAELLQRWLDETYPNTEPPVGSGLNDCERLHYAEFLTAYFCRHRHNDWSENFISNKAIEFRHHPYPTWVQDLIHLCKSHHYGLQVLMNDSFNLRIVGAGHKLVNLRYLAAILRLADVLDFDPERTPEVVFSHRSIDARSQIYWYKDHDIALETNIQAGEILVSARTTTAWIHRAILDTTDAVDFELQTCAAINDQGGFTRGVKLDDASHYVWAWSRACARDISPRPNSFIYIDGVFRPDAQRMISLMTGTRLYRTPLAAVRELLQNSFDAVREQLSIEVLENCVSFDPEIYEARAILHRVSLSWEQIDGRIWLVCSDTGVGMTRGVIEHYLLVSGSKPRLEVLELQRICAAKNIKFDRSGEFGIGALSYFMLADKLIIETRAGYDAYRDHELHGWRFEIDGLNAIGELKPLEGLRRGTTVRLRIAESKADYIRQTLPTYLATFLAKVPCTLDISLPDFHRTIQPGWAKLFDEMHAQLLPLNVASNYRNMQSIEDKTTEQEWQLVRDGARSSLRYFGPLTGDLPDGLGTYRITLPYFALEGGPSLIYLREVGARFQTMRWGRLIPLNGIGLISWRGFGLEDEDEKDDRALSFFTPARMIVEVDLTRGATISINRERLEYQNRRTIQEAIRIAVMQLFDKFVVTHSDKQRYAALSPQWIACIKDRTKALEAAAFWFFLEGKYLVWRPARLPALRFKMEGQIATKYKGINDAALARRYDYSTPSSSGGDRVEPFANLNPTKIVFFGSRRTNPNFAFRYDELSLNEYYQPLARGFYPPRAFVTAEFPPELSDVLGISSYGKVVNKNHKIFKLLNPSTWAKFLDCTAEMWNREEMLLENIPILHGQRAG